MTYQPINKDEVKRIREGDDLDVDAEDDQVHGSKSTTTCLLMWSSTYTEAQSGPATGCTDCRQLCMLQNVVPLLSQVHDYLKGGILYVYVKQASPLGSSLSFLHTTAAIIAIV